MIRSHWTLRTPANRLGLIGSKSNQTRPDIPGPPSPPAHQNHPSPKILKNVRVTTSTGHSLHPPDLASTPPEEYDRRAKVTSSIKESKERVPAFHPLELHETSTDGLQLNKSILGTLQPRFLALKCFLQVIQLFVQVSDSLVVSLHW